MNFRFVDDYWAEPNKYWALLHERLNNFGSGKENIQEKITQQKTIENVSENLHKI